jgi:hypothetical protein
MQRGSHHWGAVGRRVERRGVERGEERMVREDEVRRKDRREGR